MNGKADANNDGVVSFFEIEQYVQEKVMEWSLRNGKKQKPYTKIYGEKFGDLALTSVGSGTTVIEKEEKEDHRGLIEMVPVEGGTFQMGSTSGHSNEKPVHIVTISKDFWIGKYEVTQKEWKEVMGSNPSNVKEDDFPVECVTWYDAVEFCNKLSYKEGLTQCYSGIGESIRCNFITNGYRLPTEAEWEFAARGGKKSNGYTYSGSNSAGEVAWYRDNAVNKTHPVGRKKPNELGLYDMSGNVWEWCWDWYGNYNSSAQTEPHGVSEGEYRVVRGGFWINVERDIRTTYRSLGRPGWNGVGGFRVVQTAE